MPAIHKFSDLCGVQILQHKVLEFVFAQPLNLIAHDAGGDDNGHMGELAAEPLDVIYDVSSYLHVKDFIKTVQQQHDPPGLFEQPSEQATGPFVPDRGFFQEAEEIPSAVALPAAVGSQVDDQRNRLRDPDGGLRDISPTEGEITDQRGLAGTRIAQDDQLPPSSRRRSTKGIFDDI